MQLQLPPSRRRLGDDDDVGSALACPDWEYPRTAVDDDDGDDDDDNDGDGDDDDDNGDGGL